MKNGYTFLELCIILFLLVIIAKTVIANSVNHEEPTQIDSTTKIEKNK